jgi:hypothetical protein
VPWREELRPAAESPILLTPITPPRKRKSPDEAIGVTDRAVSQIDRASEIEELEVSCLHDSWSSS